MGDEAQIIQTTLEELYRLHKTWKGRVFSKTRSIELIECLGEYGHVSTVRNLTFFMFSASQPLAVAAAKSTARIISRFKGAEFVALDRNMRGYGYYGEYSPTIQDVERAAKFGEYSWVPLVIATCAHSGYVREASVLALKQSRIEEAIPFLLLRANDWVTEVREAARSAFWELLTPKYSGVLVDNLYLLTRLKSARSRDDTEIINAVQRLLSDKESETALFRGLESSDRYVKRTCYRIALATVAFPQDPVVKKGLRDRDPVVRLLIADSLLARKQLTGDSDQLNVLLDDWYAPIRRVALSALFQAPLDRSEALFFKHLCDSSAQIRSISRAALKHHQPDLTNAFFARYYREQLTVQDIGSLAGAVTGLGEIGTDLDSDSLMPLLKHQSAKVRRATIRALYKLNNNRFRESFIEALLYDGPGVSREARTILSASSRSLGAHRLLLLFKTATTLHVKLNLLWLINEEPRWDTLPILLNLVKEVDPPIRERVIEYLNAWISNFNKGYAKPTSQQLESAANELRAVEPLVGSDLATRLAFYFKDW